VGNVVTEWIVPGELKDISIKRGDVLGIE